MLQHSRERHANTKRGNGSSCHSEESLTPYNEIDKHRWKPGNSFKWISLCLVCANKTIKVTNQFSTHSSNVV